MNKKDEYKRIITIVLLTTFLTLIVCYPYSYQNKNKNNIIYINPEQTSVNYIGLLELGLVPNSPSRIPNHKDKFTHIIINKNWKPICPIQII